MRTIADQWASYDREVLLPAAVGEVQRTETRRAFYAGASALFALVSGLGIDDISEDQGADELEVLSQELQAFGEAIGKGMA